MPTVSTVVLAAPGLSLSLFGESPHAARVVDVASKPAMPSRTERLVNTGVSPFVPGSTGGADICKSGLTTGPLRPVPPSGAAGDVPQVERSGCAGTVEPRTTSVVDRMFGS